MLQSTPDMLALQTLVMGTAHGHAIAHAIERQSQDVLRVEQGEVLPAAPAGPGAARRTRESREELVHAIGAS